MAAMSIVAHTHPFVVGVDTHARKHVYTVLVANTGVVVDTNDFPNTTAGINRAIAWVACRTEADADTLWVIEGAASYGAILTGTVAAHGYRGPKHHAWMLNNAVALANPTRWIPTASRQQHCHCPWRNYVGHGSTTGFRQAIQILVTARESMTKDRTRSVNALTALLRSNNLGLDAGKALTKTQIGQVAKWRARKEELSVSVARAEAIRLAKHVVELSDQLTANEKQLAELVKISQAAPLMEETGFQAISAAKCLVAWSHHGRVRTEAEFASLAGVNPIPASSGNTVRYRLNPGGDRALNSALHMVAVTKMRHDEETHTYVQKRQAQKKTDREIRRCLKRYIARRVFRTLNAQNKVLQDA